MNELALRAALGSQPFRFYESVGSSNDIAAQWLRDGAPAGAVVVADEQRTGRGRKGRVWYTPPGVALALSVILKPPPDALHQMSMIGALAIADLLDSLGATDVGIKWPNDVQLNKRKVCGILPEGIWNNDRLLGVVMGMGVNVRVDFKGSDFAESATSLEPTLGRDFDRVDLIARLLARVNLWATQAGTDAVFDAWKSRLSMLGQTVTVTTESGEVRGMARDVERSGALLLETESGVQRIIAGDISML